MEYKTDKRTKNLTLRDIHVGDWVQVWSELTERYSPPLKITQICDDGTIYLVTDDEERCTPWEENIKNIDALPIDADLLRGFGFKVTLQPSDDPCFEIYSARINNALIGKLNKFTLLDKSIWDFTAIKEPHNLEWLKYMHELVGFMYRCHNDIKLEWKGIER